MEGWRGAEGAQGTGGSNNGYKAGNRDKANNFTMELRQNAGTEEQEVQASVAASKKHTHSEA